jgi:hypothetical protein
MEEKSLHLDVALSSDCRGKVIITGVMTPEALHKLIMFLELTKAVLIESEKATKESEEQS